MTDNVFYYTIDQLRNLFRGAGFTVDTVNDATCIKITCTSLGHKFLFHLRSNTKRLIHVEVPNKLPTTWIAKEYGVITMSNVIEVMNKLMISGGYKSA